MDGDPLLISVRLLSEKLAEINSNLDVRCSLLETVTQANRASLKNPPPPLSKSTKETFKQFKSALSEYKKLSNRYNDTNSSKHKSQNETQFIDSMYDLNDDKFTHTKPAKPSCSYKGLSPPAPPTQSTTTTMRFNKTPTLLSSIVDRQQALLQTLQAECEHTKTAHLDPKSAFLSMYRHGFLFSQVELLDTMVNNLGDEEQEHEQKQEQEQEHRLTDRLDTRITKKMMNAALARIYAGCENHGVGAKPPMKKKFQKKTFLEELPLLAQIVTAKQVQQHEDKQDKSLEVTQDLDDIYGTGTSKRQLAQRKEQQIRKNKATSARKTHLLDNYQQTELLRAELLEQIECLTTESLVPGVVEEIRDHCGVHETSREEWAPTLSVIKTLFATCGGEDTKLHFQ